jgi:methylthioribose-1-phosphate isomerase
VIVPRAAAAALAGALLAVACGQDPATAADKQACSRLQQVVDDLKAGRSTAVMAGLSALDVEVQVVDDRQLRDAGNSFFEGITGNVDGFEDLTIDQTMELSRQLTADLVPSLGTMLQRCKDLDVAVDLTGIS